MFIFRFEDSGSIARVEYVEDNNASAIARKKAVQPRQAETIQSEGQQVSSSYSQMYEQRQSLKDSASENTSDTNTLNERFLEKLDEGKAELIYLMRHTSIEDGVEDDVVSYVRPYYEENKYMTILWFYKLYSDFQDNSTVFSNILNIFFFLDIKHYDMPYLTSMVSNGLNSPFTMVQEVAIKVTEKWRTKECLVALKQAHYRSAWIKTYASQVISELERYRLRLT